MKAFILDYGAIADGNTLNTTAIQKAIDDCEEYGGGTVVIPTGVFVTGSIELKSNITLYLEPGAILRASGDIADYRVLPIPSDEFKIIRPWIYAVDRENIRIAGEGVLDLNDDAFMQWDKLWMAEEYAAQLNDAQMKEVIFTPKDRPSQMVLFHNCSRIIVEDISVRKCSCYTFSVSVCRNVKFHGITIDNNLQVPNNDGIYFYSCKDVIVTECVFKCADDCIAITGISNWDKITENFIVSNCTMVSRSAGVRIGHQASKVRNVVLSNLTITNSNRGIGIFASDDGWVEDIVISNIIMNTRVIAGSWWGNGEPVMISAADSTGSISRISISHVRAHSENGIHIVGCKGNIRDIALSDWRLNLSYGANRPLFGGMVDLSPAATRPALEGRIPWLYASEASDIRLSNMKAAKEDGETQDYSIEPFIELVSDLKEF